MPARILIVDDIPDVGETLALLLRHCGYEVAVRYSGREALEAIPIFAPNVVILDIGMPGMDGCELARRIRTTDDGIPLIAVTAWDTERDRAATRAAGIDHHLRKADDPETLLALLDMLAGVRDEIDD